MFENKRTMVIQRAQIKLLFIFILLVNSCKNDYNHNIREIIQLDSDWKFINEDLKNGQSTKINTDKWTNVSVPHDWAISGEFDETIDAQIVKVIADGDEVPKLRTGRTGGLPHIGVGWYRKDLEIPLDYKSKSVSIEFDGAMSNAQVYLNGQFIGIWPYGYSSFGFDITKNINFGGKNVLAVRLENKSFSSRWYPGAGLYRNVRMVVTNPIHVKQWGTYIITPKIDEKEGVVEIETTVINHLKKDQNILVENIITSPSNSRVGYVKSKVQIDSTNKVKQTIKVNYPKLWNVNDTNLYNLETNIISDDGAILDSYKSTFGFRKINFTADKGFFLNGENLKLKGVCLHHDLGPLGAAVNVSALRHRMKLLKEMGCNAIRTSHNPPTPELLELADTMGFLIIDEAFDEWKTKKNENGYAANHWDEWAEKDLISLIHRDRNHPSIIMWSLGNEVMEQTTKDGAIITKWLHDITKREDPTRPTTVGFNHWQSAINNGMANVIDLPGWNYKPEHYKEIHEKYPSWKMYGSETASTVSSRGEYYLPAEIKKQYQRNTYQSNAYETESVGWGHIPDEEFISQDNNNFMAGEFVWTGFDYLGEPSPYNEVWPSRSSYFGIIDLCGIPKDRYYLYQSKWSDKKLLHLLPHWNWSEGDKVSIHCFTNYDKAELFLNGKSLGIKTKDASNLLTTYRLVWNNIPFEAGELKVVALSKNNKPLQEAKTLTAGKPTKIKLETDRKVIVADGKELAYITVSVVDEKGVLCPKANNVINFKVEGAGSFKAVGNGDPTSLESFVKPSRKMFNGKCMLIIQSSKLSGDILITASSNKLNSNRIAISTKKEHHFYEKQ